MVDTKVLFNRFLNSVATAKSAPVVCNFPTAFESWFRVELIQTLHEIGYSYDYIETKYYYPNSKNSAGFCITGGQGDIVFELKSFVKGESSNKMKTYPEQIGRLENLFRDGRASQVIALTSFIGYRDDEMKEFMNRFFVGDSWERMGPTKPVDQYRLYIAVTSMAEGKKDLNKKITHAQR